MKKQIPSTAHHFVLNSIAEKPYLVYFINDPTRRIQMNCWPLLNWQIKMKFSYYIIICYIGDELWKDVWFSIPSLPYFSLILIIHKSTRFSLLSLLIAGWAIFTAIDFRNDPVQNTTIRYLIYLWKLCDKCVTMYVLFLPLSLSYYRSSRTAQECFERNVIQLTGSHCRINADNTIHPAPMNGILLFDVKISTQNIQIWWKWTPFEYLRLEQYSTIKSRYRSRRTLFPCRLIFYGSVLRNWISLVCVSETYWIF